MTRHATIKLKAMLAEMYLKTSLHFKSHLNNPITPLQTYCVILALLG